MRDYDSTDLEGAAHYARDEADDRRDFDLSDAVDPPECGYCDGGHETCDCEQRLDDLALDEAVEDDYRMPCGCYEYHTADCPRVTDRFDYLDERYLDEPDDYPF